VVLDVEPIRQAADPAPIPASGAVVIHETACPADERAGVMPMKSPRPVKGNVFGP